MSLRVSNRDLQRKFRGLRIPFDQPGFYDHPAFLKAEQRDHSFLNYYGRFIDTLELSPEYLDRARREIPVIAEVLRKELAAAGETSQCANINMILSRILNREGFWNYMAPGAVAIEFPPVSSLQSQHFWQQSVEGDVAHVWLVAPPFAVIDIAIKHQPYSAAVMPYMPEAIIVERTEPTDVQLSDLCDLPHLRELARRGVTQVSQLTRVWPDLLEFMQTFRAGAVTTQVGTRIKYIPCGIRASDGDLEKITTLELNGRFGVAIYEELVKPRLAELRGGLT